MLSQLFVAAPFDIGGARHVPGRSRFDSSIQITYF
jgi:hypothetical protein